MPHLIVAISDANKYFDLTKGEKSHPNFTNHTKSDLLQNCKSSTT